MDIKQSEPEDQGGSYVEAWRDLKWKRALVVLVTWAVYVPALLASIDPSDSHHNDELFGWLFVAVYFLGNWHLNGFRCPRCGQTFTSGRRECLALGRKPDASCAHCDLPLWSTNKP